MADRLKDKAAVVTGAGAIGPGWGNGKAVATLFAREGAHVFAIDINEGAALETKAIIEAEGGTCRAHQADVTDSDAIAHAVEACIAAYGGVDVLHNNVGIVIDGGPVETAEDDWERGVRVNLKSAYLMCKHVLPAMESRGGGSIINVSSTAGIRWMNVPYTVYAATKAALLGLTHNVAGQYAARNIRCNAILPGIIDTPLLRKMLADIYAAEDIPALIERRDSHIPMRRMGDAWDVAYAALYLASDEAKYVTGAQLAVDGGMSISAMSG